MRVKFRVHAVTKSWLPLLLVDFAVFWTLILSLKLLALNAWKPANEFVSVTTNGLCFLCAEKQSDRKCNANRDEDNVPLPQLRIVMQNKTQMHRNGWLRKEVVCKNECINACSLRRKKSTLSINRLRNTRCDALYFSALVCVSISYCFLSLFFSVSFYLLLSSQSSHSFGRMTNATDSFYLQKWFSMFDISKWKYFLALSSSSFRFFLVPFRSIRFFVSAKSIFHASNREIECREKKRLSCMQNGTVQNVVGFKRENEEEEELQ